MEEHQNTMETGSQDEGAGSSEGKPKVMRAGSEAKSERRILRGSGASNGGNLPAVSDNDTAEAARTILRAGQQAKEGAEDAVHVAARVSERMGEGMDGGEALSAWTSFAGRAYHRNTQAMAELRGCYTVFHLLQWQTNLFNATVADLWNTNARILRLVTHKD